jgi:hypothetical protein
MIEDAVHSQGHPTFNFMILRDVLAALRSRLWLDSLGRLQPLPAVLRKRWWWIPDKLSSHTTKSGDSTIMSFNEALLFSTIE